MNLLVFSVSGRELFGLDILAAQEIRNLDKLHQLPGSAAALAGVMIVRETTIPVIDLPTLLFGRRAEDEDPKAIILHNSATPCALKISRVEEIYKLPDDAEIQLMGHKTFIEGVVTMGGDRLLQLLDLDAVLNSAFGKTLAAAS